jgi:hypothetical protein
MSGRASLRQWFSGDRMLTASRKFTRLAPRFLIATIVVHIMSYVTRPYQGAVIFSKEA